MSALIDGSPILHAAKRHGVSVAAVVGRAQHGKAYDAQCELVVHYARLGLSLEQIGMVFGRSLSWAQRRHADGLEAEVKADGVADVRNAA